jgi:MFS family permease
MAVYVVNFIDRTIIYMLVEPIKNELKLLDWQLGLLSGMAFGLVYMAFSFPLAVAADRYHRPRLIAVCLAVWSAFTGACGLAQNFLQMVLARAGVGIGEAGCVPAAHALIADSTPSERRASALSFFAIGAPLGQLIGFMMAGYLADQFGWRWAFFVAAAPGFILTVFVFFTLREPRERVTKSRQDEGATMMETLRYLRHKSAYWKLGAGASIRAFISYGHGPFLASFFYRAHPEEVAQLSGSLGMQAQTFVGVAQAFSTGLMGMIGIWVGGRLADRAAARDIAAYGTISSISTLVLVPLMVWSFLTGSLLLAILLQGIALFVQAFWAGPVYASAQSMVPAAMRAKSSAIMIFMINFGGLLFGALCVGALSDVLSIWGGFEPGEALRWALIGTVVASIASAPVFWSARRTLAAEMES